MALPSKKAFLSQALLMLIIAVNLGLLPLTLIAKETIHIESAVRRIAQLVIQVPVVQPVEVDEA